MGVRHDGYARGLVAGDRFCGVAYEGVDNSAGGSGSKSVRVYTFGDFAMSLSGVEEYHRLKEVYATADDGISLTAGPRASFVGHVVDKLSTGVALVRLGPLGELPADDQAAQVEYFDDFLGAEVNITDGPWKIVEVGNAAAAVVTDAHAGEFALNLAADSEAEDAVLYHGDRKTFDIDSKPVFECRAKITTPGTGTTVVLGLAGDHDLDKDSVAQHAWFRLEAGLDLLVETDDGSTDNDDKDTTLNVVSGTYYTFKVDLSDPSDVKFFVDNQRMLASFTFDMSAFNGRLQPYFSLDKSSGTGTAGLTMDWVRLSATRS
jgi:hypothetical protein